MNTQDIFDQYLHIHSIYLSFLSFSLSLFPLPSLPLSINLSIFIYPPFTYSWKRYYDFYQVRLNILWKSLDLTDFLQNSLMLKVNILIQNKKYKINCALKTPTIFNLLTPKYTQYTFIFTLYLGQN